MQKEKFLNILSKIGIIYEENKELKNLTTFKIGGKADIYISPKDEKQFIDVFKYAKECEIPIFVLGSGSNVLVSDSGIEGVVISTLSLNEISVNGEIVTCGAGAKLLKVCLSAKDNSLKGLEFAYGIPGSAGGAFYMNAGAYGGEIKDVAISATCIDKNGNLAEIKAEDMDLSYRSSRFKKDGLIILSVKMKLKSGNKQEISGLMEDYFGRRKAKQPLEYPSAGSTFKRPVGYYAGALIENSGLKGFSVGGAQVSEKHSGFIINRDNATAKDVLKLINTVKAKVKEKDGVTLEEEVIFVGRKE